LAKLKTPEPKVEIKRRAQCGTTTLNGVKTRSGRQFARLAFLRMVAACLPTLT
jgi:hypothetical protein